MRRLAVWTFGGIAAVAAVAAALLEYVMDLQELAQWAAVAAVAVGVAAIAVAVWAARRPGDSAAPGPRTGSVSNRIEGNVSGPVIQADTITGGITATSSQGDRIDPSHGTPHRPATGKPGKHGDRRRSDRVPESTDDTDGE